MPCRLAKRLLSLSGESEGLPTGSGGERKSINLLNQTTLNPDG